MSEGQVEGSIESVTLGDKLNAVFVAVVYSAFFIFTIYLLVLLWLDKQDYFPPLLWKIWFTFIFASMAWSDYFHFKRIMKGTFYN